MTKPAICKLFIQNKESVKWKTSESQTKKNLKYTLVDMLAEQPLRRSPLLSSAAAQKSAGLLFTLTIVINMPLWDEMFQDMIVLRTKEYEKSKNETNPDRNEIKSYCNILDSILDIYYGNFDFFRHSSG